jgi:hypothetical protein
MQEGATKPHGEDECEDECAIHLRQHEWHSCVTAKVLMGSIGLGGAQWGGWCAAVRLCAQASSEGIKGIKCVQ